MHSFGYGVKDTSLEENRALIGEGVRGTAPKSAPKAVQYAALELDGGEFVHVGWTPDNGDASPLTQLPAFKAFGDSHAERRSTRSRDPLPGSSATTACLAIQNREPESSDPADRPSKQIATPRDAMSSTTQKLDRRAFEAMSSIPRPRLHRYCARMAGSVIDGRGYRAGGAAESASRIRRHRRRRSA